MNLDNILFKLLLNKTIYNKYNNIINMDFYKNNSKELFKIFTVLTKLHESSNDDITLENFALGYFTHYPVFRDEEKLYVDGFLTTVASVEYDEDSAKELLKAHHEKIVASEIAIKALDISQGRGEFTQITDLMNTLEIVEEEQEEMFVTSNLSELMAEIYTDKGLSWRLETLNKSLGSLRKGDFGFFYARPETGKTTLLASEGTYMALQAAEKGWGSVLWLNNEEKGSKVMLRCFQAAFGITTKELYDNLAKYEKLWNEQYADIIRIRDNAKLTRNEVEKLCEKVNPSLIIFDQLDKIAWPDNERYDLKMKAIYQWGRELSKAYAPFLAVCQAGGSAEGKKYLDMTDVDSSYTAKQGEADFMFGLGKTHDEKEENLRFISISKNKLMGDKDTLEDMRHAKVPIIINPTIARYSDYVKF